MAVVLHVRLCRFRCVMRCVLQVPVCRMRVVRRRQMIVGLVMFRGLAMVPRRVLVVLRCPFVMLDCLFGHWPSSAWIWAEGRDGNHLL